VLGGTNIRAKDWPCACTGKKLYTRPAMCIDKSGTHMHTAGHVYSHNVGLMLGPHFRVRFNNVGELQSVCQHALSTWIGTNVIHDFMAVTFFVKLAFFREKRLFRCMIFREF